MATKIITCTCQCAYQDKMYGKGNRVANDTAKTKGEKQYRCTVCRTTK